MSLASYSTNEPIPSSTGEPLDGRPFLICLLRATACDTSQAATATTKIASSATTIPSFAPRNQTTTQQPTLTVRAAGTSTPPGPPTTIVNMPGPATDSPAPTSSAIVDGKQKPTASDNGTLTMFLILVSTLLFVYVAFTAWHFYSCRRQGRGISWKGLFRRRQCHETNGVPPADIEAGQSQPGPTVELPRLPYDQGHVPLKSAFSDSTRPRKGGLKAGSVLSGVTAELVAKAAKVLSIVQPINSQRRHRAAERERARAEGLATNSNQGCDADSGVFGEEGPFETVDICLSEELVLEHFQAEEQKRAEEMVTWDSIRRKMSPFPGR